MVHGEPRRLVFGPGRYGDAVVVESASAIRWDAASRAETWAEFVGVMYEQTWAQYIAETGDDETAPTDAFDFEEWLNDTWVASPSEQAQ